LLAEYVFEPLSGLFEFDDATIFRQEGECAVGGSMRAKRKSPPAEFPNFGQGEKPVTFEREVTGEKKSGSERVFLERVCKSHGALVAVISAEKNVACGDPPP